MMNDLLNRTDYTLTEHLFFGVGCLLWVVVYFFTINNIRQKNFVEIPVITVCGNIAWEFLWSWVFVTDMGLLFVWGYRLWFFLDCYIVYGLFRYGAKQIDIPELRRHARPIFFFCLWAWLAILYYYIKNYDAPISHMGAYSGYILNLLISGLYIPLFLRSKNHHLFSYPVAWCKGLGTLLISVFCFLHFTDGFLLIMCLVTAVLDGAYIYLFARARNKQAAPDNQPSVKALQ